MTTPYSTDWALSQGYVHVPLSSEHSLLMAAGMARAASDQAERSRQYDAEANLPATQAALTCAVTNHYNALTAMDHFAVANPHLKKDPENPLNLVSITIARTMEELVRELNELSDMTGPVQGPAFSREKAEIVTWYIDQLEQIQKLAECRRLAADYAAREAHGLPWDDAARQAVMATLHQSATKPRPPIGNTWDQRQVPDAGLHSEATQATEETALLLNQTTARYNESLPFDVHHSFAAVPDVEDELRRRNVPPIGALIETLYVSMNPDDATLPPGLRELAENFGGPQGAIKRLMTSVTIVAYIHNGRKIVRPLASLNPYPKGFDRDTAVIHAKQAVAAMEDTDQLTKLHGDGIPPIPPFILQAYAHAARHSLKLAEAGLHSATSATLPTLLKEEAALGLPPGALKEMVNKLTTNDPQIAATLIQDPHSTWRQMATLQQTKDLLLKGKELGIDPYTLGRLALEMGHDPSKIEYPPHPFPEEKVRALIETAIDLGIDPATARLRLTAFAQ